MTVRQSVRATTVLFDLDGTLIDTNELIIDAFLYALRGVTSPDFGREQIIPHMGQPLSVQMRLFSGRQDVDDLIAAYREYCYRHHDERVRLFPGARETVRALRRAGYKLGVVTTKMRATSRLALSQLGLESAMDALVSIDDVTYPKPHPEPVERALQALGSRPDEALMIGDSPVDITAARRAGAIPVGVAWSLKGERLLREAGAAYVLQRMSDLLALVGIGTEADRHEEA